MSVVKIYIKYQCALDEVPVSKIATVLSGGTVTLFCWKMSMKAEWPVNLFPLAVTDCRYPIQLLGKGDSSTGALRISVMLERTSAVVSRTGIRNISESEVGSSIGNVQIVSMPPSVTPISERDMRKAV